MRETSCVADVEIRGNESPARRAAAQLCTELTAGAVRPPVGKPRNGVFAWVRQCLFRNLETEVERHRQELLGSKPRPFAVLRFARFLEAQRWTDLSTVPWSLLHRLCPGDPIPAAALAKLFLERARRGDRKLGDRLRDYDRFFRYAGRAIAVNPTAYPIQTWRTAAAVEVTILKGQYAAP